MIATITVHYEIYTSPSYRPGFGKCLEQVALRHPFVIDAYWDRFRKILFMTYDRLDDYEEIWIDVHWRAENIYYALAPWLYGGDHDD